MDPVSPINLFVGAGNNPFVLEMLAHPKSTGVSARHFQTLPPHDEVSHAFGDEDPEKVVDTLRLARDRQYLAEVLGWVLGKARYAFKSGWLGQAERYYRYFFSYHRFYPAPFFSGFRNHYYPALFEYAWVMDIQKKRQAGQRALNLQFLEMLQRMLKSVQEPIQHQTLEAFVHVLQTQEQLPRPEVLHLPIDPEGAMKLFKHLLSHGMRDWGRHVLGHLEIQQLLILMRTEQTVHAYYAHEIGREEIPETLLPFHYLGVPIAPWLPPTDRRPYEPASSEELHPYYVDLVEGIPPVRKPSPDPDRDQNQGRKKRQTSPQEEAQGEHSPENPFI